MNPIIIGGGVIGLSIGWHLARLGAPVWLFEKETVGSGASHAAAGMITPASEVRFGEETLLELFLESLKIYPRFIEELEKASGIKTDFHTSGSLMVAIDEDDQAELTRFHDYQKELGLSVNWLSPEKALEKEPALSPRFFAAVEATGECFLDNQVLIQALKAAFLKSGGKLFEHRPVDGVEIQNNRITGVRIGKEKIACSKLILASGVHAKLEGLPEELIFPLRPIKGQALELKLPKQVLSRAIRTLHRYPVYLVPRFDGRIVVGATSEEMGFDRRVTAEAVLNLLFGAYKILPLLDQCELSRTWVGHRAATPDHTPILGPTSIEGLTIALGMYRHGILLTPIVGKLISQQILHQTRSPFFEAFGPSRFHQRVPA